MSVQILIGDVREKLAELADDSVDMVVTSPPYFALRDYGTATWEGGDAGCEHLMPSKAGKSSTMNTAQVDRQSAWRAKCPCGAVRVDHQIGLEASPEEFIQTLAEVFRVVRRKLKPTGTLWINIGDSAASSGGLGQSGGLSSARVGRARDQRNVRPGQTFDLVKKKDRMGIPWALAFALRAGWATCTGCQLELRADVWPVWRGRRTCIDCLQAGRLDAAVQVTERGWSLRQDIIWHKPNCMPESVTDRCTTAHEYLFLFSRSRFYHFDQAAIAEAASPNTHARISQKVDQQKGSQRANGGTRADRPMKAMRGRSPKTEAAGARVKNNPDFVEALGTGIVEFRNKRSVWTVATAKFEEAHYATYPPALIRPAILAGCPRGGVVLDPFGGSGTTAQVADELGRDCILIDLDPRCGAFTAMRLRDNQRGLPGIAA